MRVSPVVVDLDSDGRREVVLATDSGDVRVVDLETGQVVCKVRVSSQEFAAAPAVADLNCDGVADIVVATRDFHLWAIDGRAVRAARVRGAR